MSAAMQVVVHEDLAMRRRRLARRMVLFGFIILIGGLFIGSGDSRSLALSYGALIVGTILSWSGVALMDRWMLPPRPEIAIREAMAGSNAGWKLYHWVLGADHVALAPWGLTVIEPYNFDGPLTVHGKRWRDQRSIVRRLLSIGRRPVRDPSRLLDIQVEALRDDLRRHAPDLADVPIERVMVLTHPRAVLHAEDPNVPVMLAADLKRALRADFGHRPLKPADQRALRDALDAEAAVRLAPKKDKDEDKD